MTNPLPDPDSAPELFAEILQRRVMAYILDVVLLTVIVSLALIIGVILGVFSGGALLIALPFAIPIAIVGYYAVTLGSPARATIGMRTFDLVLTPTRGEPLDGWKAFLHPVIFWLTCWILPVFNLIFALLSPRRQMIHDYFTGTMMVRRSPMVRHWSHQAHDAA